MNLTGLNGAMLRHFGEPVTLPSGGVVAGIFDEPRQSVSYERERRSSLEAALDQPRVALLSSDADGLKERDQLTIRARRYAIARPPLPDGAGMTALTLAPAQEAVATPEGWQ